LVDIEDEPSQLAADKLMTKDEARQIAANIAKLPNALRVPTRAQMQAAATADTSTLLTAPN
jgi:hypothetical protein